MDVAAPPVLEPGTGIVLHDGGGAVAGARVHLLLEQLHAVGESPLPVAVTSGPDGRFAIPPEFLLPGRTLALAEREGYGPGASYLEADHTMRIVLGRRATLRGRVVRAESGAPIAGAEVSAEAMVAPAALRHDRTPLPLGTTTDIDGRFSFDDCHVGVSLVISVRPPDALPYEQRFTPPTIGEHLVELAVPAGETLLGRALDRANGHGVAGARIRVGGTATGATLADGGFRVGRVPRPTFPLEVSAEGYLPSVEHVDAAKLAAPPLIVFLERECVLEGLVADPGGDPVDGVRVSLHDDYGEGAAGLSGADGTYRVGAIPAGRAFSIRAARRGVSPTYRFEGLVTFDEAGTELRRDLVLPFEDTRLSGRVTEGGVGALARLEWRSGDLSAVTTTDGHGAYAFGGVATGRMTLTVRVLTSGTTTSREVEISRRGSTRLDVEVASGGGRAPTTRIAGRVRDANGDPAVAVEVVAVARGSGVELRVRTDAEGRFAFDAASANDRYALRVDVAGRTLSRFGVQPGTTDLVLAPSR